MKRDKIGVAQQEEKMYSVNEDRLVAVRKAGNRYTRQLQRTNIVKMYKACCLLPSLTSQYFFCQ